jgi:nucleoside-diphosphate kinase
MERTFLMVKPDGVKRKLVGEIISRFERKGLTLAAMEMRLPSRELAQKHYAVHNDKPFFESLVTFIMSGPVVAMVWEGPDAISIARKVIGATRPSEAAPGTIRGDFCIVTEQNLIHGSDAIETAAYEIGLWFPNL